MMAPMSAGESVRDAQFRLLVASVQDYAIFLLDADGIVQSWNAGAERIKGYKADEIVGKHISVFYSPEDRAAATYDDQLRRAVQNGHVEDHGWRVRKDGSRFWANVVVTPLFEGGRHIGFAKITRDASDGAYRAFVEASGAIVWTADALGRANADSPSWRAFTGQTEAEWLGLRGWDPLHPDDLPIMRVEWPRAKSEKRPFEAEFRLRRHDGVYVWMVCRAIPFFDARGEIREWFGVNFDISARKRAEIERVRAETWWQTTLRSIGDGVIATDAQGNVRFLNPVAEQLTGWAHDEVQDRPLKQVFPIFNEETGEAVENPVDKVLREGKVVGLANHTVLVRRDGSARPIDDSAAPIRDPQGGLEGVVLVFRDVSAEKRAEARSAFLARAGDQLIASHDYRDALAQVTKLAVPRLADWCAVSILENGVLEQLAVAHVDPSKVEYAHELQRRYPPDPHATTGAPNVARTGQSELYSEIPRELLEAAAVDDEHRRIIRELDLRSAMVVPLRGREHVFGVITFVYAASDRRYDAEDLSFAEELARRAALIIERRKLEEEAAIANRAKDEFLATVSHELRTPLQAILGWATMLRRGSTRDPEQAIEAIVRNATAQARLIDDILDVSRIISGKLRLSIARVHLASVIRGAIDAVRPAAAARRIELVENVPDTLGDLDADPDRLQQIVWNVASNAVKFTPEGGRVEIIAERTDTTAKIAIKDTGPGIPREHLNVIFERFRQVDSSSTRTHGGLGLGLAIVRYLVEAHGGTVVAASEGRDQGATFTVTLPVHLRSEAPPASPKPAQPGALAGVRVLVVDDDPDGRWLIGEALAHVGALVDTAGTVGEAFAMFCERRHDVVISDIGMPDEDGYSLARRIRALPSDQGSDAVAVALTAYARQTDIRASEQAGFNLHLGKPVEPQALIDAVASLVRR
jgi:PAS domain S-box-containing protein